MMCATVSTPCRTAQTIWTGLDVAKGTFDAALYPAFEPGLRLEQNQIPRDEFARTRQGAKAFLAWADSILAHSGDPEAAYSLRVVMEATGSYSMELSQWLRKLRPSLGPAIVNPAYIRHFAGSLGVRNKTDDVDSRVIARYGDERSPAPDPPRSPEMIQLRALSRERDALVATRVAEQNRAAEPCPTAALRDMRKRRIRQLQKDIQAVEQAMIALVKAHPALKKAVALLDSLPGVGFKTAVVILAEIGDLTRFQQARKLAAFVGVSPRRRKSGTSVQGGTHLCKQGNSRARAALYMAALGAVRGKSQLAHLYQALLQNGKTPMAALGVIMRKLIVLMRAVLLSETPYQHDFQRCGKQVNNP